MISVVAAVVCRRDTYLLCLRPPEKNHGGLWEFPGGKVQEGESLESAVRRELREELGTESTPTMPPLAQYQDGSSEFQINFVSTQIVGEPQCLEHDAIGWFPMSRILDMSLAPADRQFATRHLMGN